MYRLASLIVLLCLFAPASALADEKSTPTDKKPPLTFTQDGKDLVVKTTVTANASSHVLWTDVIDMSDKVVLRYYIIQNPDLAVRSEKQVAIEWRLPNQKKEGKEFQVETYFQPNTEQLKELFPQLQKLMEEGEKWKKSTEPKK